VKNHIFSGAALQAGVVLSTTASATLAGDDISGSSTGLDTFNTGVETITFDFDPEFGGSQDLFGDGSLIFDFGLFFSDDLLTLFVDHNLSGSTRTMKDFTVTLMDLDYIGFPTYVLTDVTHQFDSLGTGAGLSVSFTEDSIELSFDDFEIPESREIQLALLFEEEDPTTPVPEPTSLALLAVGVCGLALRRKRSDR